MYMEPRKITKYGMDVCGEAIAVDIIMARHKLLVRNELPKRGSVSAGRGCSSRDRSGVGLIPKYEVRPPIERKKENEDMGLDVDFTLCIQRLPADSRVTKQLVHDTIARFSCCNRHLRGEQSAR